MKNLFPHLQFRLEGGSLFERMFVDDGLRTHIQTNIVCGILAVISGVRSLIDLAGGAEIMALSTGLFALLSLLSLVITVISGSHRFISAVMAAAIMVLYAAKSKGRDRIETDFVGASRPA